MQVVVPVDTASVSVSSAGADADVLDDESSDGPGPGLVPVNVKVVDTPLQKEFVPVKTTEPPELPETVNSKGPPPKPEILPGPVAPVGTVLKV